MVSFTAPAETGGAPIVEYAVMASTGAWALGTQSVPTEFEGDQMKAMQQMHEKMVAAKTPAERNALMAEQMKLMQIAQTQGQQSAKLLGST